MSTDFTESDEDAVSDGTTMPEQPCTDDLPDPLDQQVTSESASSTASSPRKTTTVFEQVRIGRLTLNVDDPNFAYAMQCGVRNPSPSRDGLAKRLAQRKFLSSGLS